MAYLIQGIAFEKREAIGLAYDPVEENILTARITSLSQFMYAGAIWEEGGRLTGKMQDECGMSTLFDIHISESMVRFEKKYDDRDYPISYSMPIRDGIAYVGRFSSQPTGSGASRCIITEVPDDFFYADATKGLPSEDEAA